MQSTSVRGLSKVGEYMIRYQRAGIDMSGSYFDICLTVGRKCHESRFNQGEAGFKSLSLWLKELGVNRCWFGIEHTGGYEQALAVYLLNKGHRVSLLDGFKVHRFKESEGKRGKTDKGDARMIAKFLADKRPALWTPRPDSFGELLELKNQREDIVQAITAWTNRRNSPKSNAYVHSQQETLIEVLKIQLPQIEEEIKRCVESDAEIERCVRRMTTPKGIGFTTAVAFLAEAGPINRSTYPTPESLVLAAGLAPLPWLSGTSVKGTYSRPYGNERMRNCLSLAASTARRYDPAMALFARRMQERGKDVRVQNRAIARKLVHIIWGLIVNDEDYSPAKAVWKFSEETKPA